MLSLVTSTAVITTAAHLLSPSHFAKHAFRLVVTKVVGVPTFSPASRHMVYDPLCRPFAVVVLDTVSSNNRLPPLASAVARRALKANTVLDAAATTFFILHTSVL